MICKTETTLDDLLGQCELDLAAGRTDDAKEMLLQYRQMIWDGNATGQPRQRERAYNLTQRLYPNSLLYPRYVNTCHCGRPISLEQFHQRQACQCQLQAFAFALNRETDRYKRLRAAWKPYDKLPNCFNSTTSLTSDGNVLTTSVYVGPQDTRKSTIRKKATSHKLNGFTPAVKTIADTLRAMLTEEPSYWKRRTADLIAACDQMLAGV